jgi:hypothetical protein
MSTSKGVARPSCGAAGLESQKGVNVHADSADGPRPSTLTRPPPWSLVPVAALEPRTSRALLPPRAYNALHFESLSLASLLERGSRREGTFGDESRLRGVLSAE